MKILPEIVRKNGFTYTQVLKKGRTCIYEQMVAENLHYYEVFIVRSKKEQVFPNGKIYPPRELFPCDEDFGKTAWSCRTLKDAMKKFDDLNNAIAKTKDK